MLGTLDTCLFEKELCQSSVWHGDVRDEASCVLTLFGVRKGGTNPMRCHSISDQSTCTFFGEKCDVDQGQFPPEESTHSGTISHAGGKRFQLADFVESEELREYAREHVVSDS